MNSREIKSLVSIDRILNELRVRVRGRRRADCPFCQGHQVATLSFNREGLWKCFRCNIGGDSIKLVMLVLRVDFQSALRWLADLAGLSLSDFKYSRKEFEKYKKRHRRLEGEKKRFKAWRRGLGDIMQTEHRELSQRAAHAEGILTETFHRERRIPENPETEQLWAAMAAWYHREVCLTEALDFTDFGDPENLYKEYCKRERNNIG